MRIKYIYIILAATLLGFASCKDDELLVPGDGITDEMRDAYFIIGNQVATRTTHVNDEYTVFDNGDEIGAFALTDDGQNALDGEPKNVCYTVAELSNSEPNDYGYKARVLLPKDNKKKLSKGLAKYFFYYPYNPDIKELDDLKNLTHKVYDVQTEHDNYIKSDLLWDIAFGEEDKCLIMMDHAMANIIISIDGVEYDAEKGAVIIDMPLIAGGVNLTAPNLAEMTAPDGRFAYSNPLELEGQEFSDIKAKQVQYTSSTDKFRAAVPANCTLEGGKDIIRLWTKGNNSQPKVFKLKKDVTLEPGKNYIFTLIKKGQPQPELTDEDSWVLDVLDPETGDVVGLLCREYIRYQPEHTMTDRNYEKDQITYPFEDVKTKAHNDELSGLTMSSQAWVFYNMDNDGRSPDLTTGQILRVIYDVRTNLNNAETAAKAWPAPYMVDYNEDNFSGGRSHSMYAVNHGHDWIADKEMRCGRSTAEDGSDDGKMPNQRYYEFWQPVDGEYYTMHGSRIKWCPEHNLVNYFELYGSKDINEKRVSNIIAKEQGHIAIPTNGAKPYVSFDPIDSENPTRDIPVRGTPNKVGYTMPHYLIDSRINTEDRLEITRYPLVKIGYNQFWMSKSLKIRYLDDKNKTALNNYTDLKYQINQFYSENVWYDAGYIYPPSVVDEKQFDSWDINLLYNTNALLSDGFKPQPAESTEEYQIPSENDLTTLWDYLGWKAFNKLMSSDMLEKDENGNYIGNPAPKSQEEAYARGFLNTRNGLSANISGFNLKATGYRSTNSEWPRSGESNECIALLLAPKKNTKLNLVFNSQVENFENTSTISDMFVRDNYVCVGQYEQLPPKYNQGAVFAPVRLYLEFVTQKNKPCSCGINRSVMHASSSATRSGSNGSETSRNVYVEIVTD